MGGAIAGGLLAGMLSLGRAAGELVTRRDLYPASQRKGSARSTRYFDVLEFIKYRPSEEAAELAWKKEGLNIDKILSQVKIVQAEARTEGELRRLRAPSSVR